MPFKSQDLLRYFARSQSVFPHTGNDVGSMEKLSVLSSPLKLPKVKDDCVALTTKEEITLRSTLLMLGLHYSWRTGSLADFEKAFLFHKGELIHRVNAWLEEDPGQTTVDCLKQIAILSISESCAGNYPTAETHLNGLLTVLDMKARTSRQDETLDRLILLAHHFASAVKSRLRTAPSIEDTDQARIWQLSFTVLSENLVALRLIPYYFPRYDRTPKSRIDAHGVISALQRITEAEINRTGETNAHYLHDGDLASE
ncbi:hypothetical protein QQS21_003393 [Conoideocrella luteorostrata]|uniref:Uncharacterized protein n=1 Tax=Conoideocrella luteorostrata TaxID=1105319 RepID=A0AAJ0CXI7_9HYPO|nr:hypothetical protein QQS21_003393 [Conoideocrella luteorostrata]